VCALQVLTSPVLVVIPANQVFSVLFATRPATTASLTEQHVLVLLIGFCPTAMQNVPSILLRMSLVVALLVEVAIHSLRLALAPRFSTKVRLALVRILIAKQRGGRLSRHVMTSLVSASAATTVMASRLVVQSFASWATGPLTALNLANATTTELARKTLALVLATQIPKTVSGAVSAAISVNSVLWVSTVNNAPSPSPH
jgi:hypothetical protein